MNRIPDNPAHTVVCVYLPDAKVHAVGRPNRGAWRVVACFGFTGSRPVLVSGGYLFLFSHRKRAVNSWCSPRKILAEWQREQWKISQEVPAVVGRAERAEAEVARLRALQL